jgi:LssY C-terminus
MDDEPRSAARQPRSLRRRIALVAGGLLLVYLGVAYLILPFAWKGYERRHPSLDDVPGITHTADGIPGDPLNVALVGAKADLVKIMLAAKWHPADPLSLKNRLEIAEASVLKRPYDDAPVSSLYLFGRKEDLAFEQPVGDSPRHRHHVRFWQTDKLDADGRPIWVGSAVYDERVGLSRTTGQVTHVTAADVDAERDYLFRCLEQTGDLTETYVVNDFHKTREGRNGGGDPWHTDGRLYVGVIAVKSTREPSPGGNAP